LLTLCSPRLLPLILHCRPSLLRRGLDWGWSLNVFATPLRWLLTWGSRTALLGRRSTLDILRSWTSLRRLFLSSPLNWCRRFLCSGLLTLYSPRLLPLIVHCRPSLLRRGLEWCWSLNVFATPLRRLRAWGSRTALLGRRCTLDILRSWTSHRRLILSSPLNWCRYPLCSLLLNVLLDYRFTRLVSVMLVAERLLLLQPGIPIS
jgi:hypothetical protein